jgi:TolB-like protein/DNA-binding winged helix-turn-helix (wHTH) protein/tetratricopeptide (TPR) repeat protein
MRVQDAYEFGPFRLDLAKRRLLRDGQPIPLTPKVLDILLVLVENRGRVVDKEELLRNVWPDTTVEEGNLTQSISILRKTMGETPEQHQYIETVPKRGYRFVADVTQMKAQPRMRTGFVVAFSVLLACAAVFIYWRVAPGFSGKRRAEGIRAIAVLPFANVSSDAADEYFSDGLTDELIVTLSKVEGLRVPARSSAFQFKGKSQDVRTIAKLLNVGAILEGSVRKENDNLRVTAQLSEATSGYQLWSETYTGNAKDVFAIQESIARAIVDTLQIRLGGRSKTPFVDAVTNPKAYELTLRGRQWGYREPTLETLAQGVRFFAEAIAADPRYAPAYSGLSYIHMKSVCYDIAPKEACPKAKQAAETALQLDGTLTEPRITLGNVKLWCEWDFAGAEREYQQALQIDPNKADAYLWYSFYLGATGRSEEALKSIRRALELNPLDPGTNLRVAWVYYHGRQYDRAIEAVHQAWQLNPHSGGHALLAGAYGAAGRYQEAIATNEKEGDPNHPVTVSRRAYYLALAGKRSEALNALQHLKEIAKVRYVSAARWAEVYAGLGDKEKAFYWLEKAIEEHSPSMFHLKVSPEFDILRSDPRFERLLKRIYG